MISIQLANGTLDVNEGEEVALNHTAWRFCEEPTDEFSNDFEIPKTRHNLQVLGASGLLYSPNQRYGNEIKPCTLNVSGRMFDARLQVVSVGKDTISICLYVNNVPDAIKGVTLRDLFWDNLDNDTILPWWKDSWLTYPAWFPKYDYGMPFRTYYAQRHPVKSVAAILREIAARTGVQMPTLDSEYFLMANHAKVCPYNRHQVVRARLSDSTVNFYGGKHIANDVSYSESGSIVFNRMCNVRMRITTSYRSTSTWLLTNAEVALHLKDDSNSNLWSTYYALPVNQWVNYDVTNEYTFTAQPNSTFTINVENAGKYDDWHSVINFIITDYEVNDGDFDEDLEYRWELPSLNPVWDNGDYSTTYSITTHADHSRWIEQSYSARLKNSPQVEARHVQVPLYYYNYFGYYTNVENCKVTDLLCQLAYAEGKKLRFDRFNNAVEFVPNDDYTVLTDVNITEVRPSSDRFGQKNYILYNSEEMDNKEPITKIDNIWLEEQKTIWQSKIFKQEASGDTVKIAQYSNPEYDADNKEYKCDYEEVEGIGLVKGEYDSNGKLTLKPVILPANGFEDITSVMEVQITDFGSYRDDTDYIYINGIKFMVVEVTRNISGTEQNEITAIEISNNLWA